MPVLRQPLRRPETYLILLGIVLVFLALDTFRSPSSQLTGQLYVRGVHLYQVLGRPLLRGRIMCRYRPTCSEYSIEAVKRHGLRQGLALTLRRLESCTTDVRPGTYDPVPASEATSTVESHTEVKKVAQPEASTGQHRKQHGAAG